MSRKLFLTSAGLPVEIRSYFLQLLDKKPQDSVVCFIPTAAYPEVDKSFVEQSKDELREIGIKEIMEVDLKDETKETLLSKLVGCDVIYMNGGNTFYLLDYVKKSGFDQILGKLLDEGKIYVGVSAGSIIVGPNVETAGWEGFEVHDENIVDLKNLHGLDLVSFAVSPHFVESDRKPLEEGSKNVNYPIIAINDTQAVLCLGDQYKILGKGEELIYNKDFIKY